MRTRVIKDKGLYYVQFLEAASGFAADFQPMKWKFYGNVDDEAVFNKQVFIELESARTKAKMLANFNAIEIIAEFE